ncbi:hypothetical protein JOB18_017533 [Solea senegalensis]|uniref:Uncharacterized protein n=1 Tax=Solea senegalensis TaxID=28829 RepID=A0AAV6S3R3_SOLSE|nr:hypothetical protein JOB18_017533 [Solea senegalensis]
MERPACGFLRPRQRFSGSPVKTQNSTTTWQHLEMGIMAGCTILPLPFTIAVELTIRGSGRRKVWEWPRSSTNLVVQLRNHAPEDCCRSSRKNIKRALIEVKPSTSRRISIVKVEVKSEQFHFGEPPIPTVLEKPIKRLCCCM